MHFTISVDVSKTVNLQVIVIGIPIRNNYSKFMRADTNGCKRAFKQKRKIYPKFKYFFPNFLKIKFFFNLLIDFQALKYEVFQANFLRLYLKQVPAQQKSLQVQYRLGHFLSNPPHPSFAICLMLQLDDDKE